MSIQKNNTIDATRSLVKETVNEEWNARYGTSFNENMGRKHEEEIKNKIRKLRKEFEAIDKDKNSLIDINEWIEFFSNQRPELRWTKDYMRKIFRLLDMNSDNQLTVEEFIEAYIKMEEKIKTKYYLYSKTIEEIKEQKKTYINKLEKYQNEESIGNGWTNNSTVYITIIEGKGLSTTSMIGQCKPFVLLQFDGREEKTTLQSGDNPAWNENFEFRVTKPNLSLKLQIIDQSMLASKVIGEIQLLLNDFDSQKSVISWYDLYLDDAPTKCQLHLKIQYIYSKIQYIQNTLLVKDAEIANFNRKMNILHPYFIRLQEPFSIIFAGEVDQLFRERVWEEDEDVNNWMELRKSTYAPRGYEQNAPIWNQLQNVISVDFVKKQIEWSNLTKIMMYVFISLSFFALLARPDFFNWVISIGIFILFIYDKTNDISKHWIQWLITIGISLGYDLVWLVLEHKLFWSGWNGDWELWIKRLVYFMCCVNFIVKGCLMYLLNALRKKQQEDSWK